MRKSLWRVTIKCEKDGYTFRKFVRASSQDEAREHAKSRLRPSVRISDLEDLGPIVVLQFAQLDCKDQRPVFTDYPYRPYRGRNTDEEKVRVDMELEYLLAIRELQERIKEKYAPLLESIDDREDPESEVRRVHDEHYKAHRAEWDEASRVYYH